MKDRQAGEGGTRERGLAGEREGLAGEREGPACEGWTGGRGERAREGRTGKRERGTGGRGTERDRCARVKDW